MNRLAALDERAVRVVELKVFAGMASREAAYVLGISRGTVEADWKFARRWLRRRMVEE